MSTFKKQLFLSKKSILAQWDTGLNFLGVGVGVGGGIECYPDENKYLDREPGIETKIWHS
jgi:hypothetical protein